MKIIVSNLEIPGNRKTNRHKRRETAFSLVEMLVASVVTLIVFVALYTGLAQGFRMIENARINTRSVEVMTSKIEWFRLLTWDQITNSAFVPDTFTEPVFPDDEQGEGPVFNGTIDINPVSFSTSYSNTLKEVVITLTWNAGGRAYTNQFSTLVAKDGMQNYIY
ncbi:MAG: prepilin-type N-terminal cleavage/methylation domain-containing protein [Verrucomicrobia bacterium]|nr:prepilin-type N-terminal cleavage/methylation domain-containing protein [Verrucomicrobiota bacterium]MCF7708046.1 prepilin-type N-terminal cleavage/methylation domain-containing protein [Verrucomicrobiota bacterium]